MARNSLILLLGIITFFMPLSSAWGVDSSNSSEKVPGGYSAQEVKVGSVTTGRLEVYQDQNYFRFTPQQGANYVFYTRGSTDTGGTLYDDQFNQMSTDCCAGGGGNFRITQRLTPGRSYYVLVRGQPGPYTLYVDGPESSAANENNNSGVPALVKTEGYASVSGGITISPATVIPGQNFAISFSLKEARGKSKTLENVAIAILRADNTYVFDFAMYSNVTIDANGTWSKTATNHFFTSQLPGTYKAVIRGKFQGQWFDFDATGSGTNPISFSVEAAPDTTKPIVSSFNVTPSSDSLGRPFTASYTVSDKGGLGLKQVELWRANDNGGNPGAWKLLATRPLSGNGPTSGSFSDIPSATGTYWYGVHVADNVGNWNTEPSPRKVMIAASSLNATEGWSDVTGYHHAETNTQRAIVAAVPVDGSPSPLSTATGSNVVWRTDAYSGDGKRMRDAIGDVYDYWVGSGRPMPPLVGPLPSSVQNTMRTRLSASYPLAQQNALIARITSVFNGTVPTTDNATLQYLGIRAQCKEFVDRMVQTGGGTTHSYGYAAATRRNIRPGMYAFKNDNSHAAIILAVLWDVKGEPTSLRIAEANYGTGWHNPEGQVPWERVIGTTREVRIADYYVVNTEK